MCGIVGFVNNVQDLCIVEDMLSIQSYRGPDDNGTYYDEDTGVHMGHNRLSIQDLSSNAHQPFISDCKKYCIVFNGEIYNFNSIRLELECKGYKFISNSDTEVILYSYKEWGIHCLERFIGMFSFSILDKVKNKLFLVRDRAGVKPLYYYYNGSDFIFSSELKSFHKHPNFIKSQNLDILPYYFQFGYIPAPYTIFNNCYKLKAGHYIILSLDDLRFDIHKYWDVNEYYSYDEFEPNEEDLTEVLESLLDESINLRMISDVPVGVFLSGGYDSSLVSAILSKKQNRKIKTFTIGFGDEDLNEAHHAKKIAQYLGTDHTEYYMNNSDILNLVVNLPFYFDEPFGDSSSLPMFIVSKLAKEKVSVVLSSDGGDEAFCGYSKYFYLNKFKNIFSNRLKKKLLVNTLGSVNLKFIDFFNEKLPVSYKQTNIRSKYIKFRNAINSANLEEMFENASSYVTASEVKNFLKVHKDQEIFKDWYQYTNENFLNYMMSVDYKLFMCDDVLTKVDRTTMSVSLEGREPLLDHRIIEFMARVPLEIKYKNNNGKYLLRKVLYKYLPKDLVDKPKAGFTVPLDKWLRYELRPLVEKYLSRDNLDENIFDISEIIKIKDCFYNGDDLGTQIWFILVYQMWKEQWLD